MEQFIGFKLNSSEYMVPILNVREIITMPSITVLPQLPSYVQGVTNIRGSIIPVVSLKHLLNTGGDEETGTTVIIIASGKLSFGIVIDGITGVVNTEKDNIETPEKFVSNNLEQIEGVAKLKDKLVVLLNVKKLLPLDDLSLLEDAVVEVHEIENSDQVEVIKEIDTLGGKVTIKELHDAKEYLGTKGLDPAATKIFDMMLDFMDALSTHDYNKVDGVINNLIHETDSDLFKEVGKITRKLHDSIEEFKGAVDSGLQKLTTNDVPNAIDNLQFVIDRTEDAANKTMAIVERFYDEEKNFDTHLEKIKANKESYEYFMKFKESMDNDMTTILTAQQFQDITGQTIRKVIGLVNSVETEMVNLITNFGMPVASTPDIESIKEKEEEEQVYKMEEVQGEKVSQSDVEALLNDLGF